MIKMTVESSLIAAIQKKKKQPRPMKMPAIRPEVANLLTRPMRILDEKSKKPKKKNENFPARGRE